MTKQALLEHLAEVGDVDATEVAGALGVPYAAAAMALLRLVRQGLVIRYVDPHGRSFWYRLSDRGKERLAYFHEAD